MARTSYSQGRGSTSQLVLRTIYDQGAISRADVARRTLLTPPTVSDAVSGLLAAGLVAEIGPGASTGGKRPTLLKVVDDSRHLIGLDLGVGDLRGAVLNLRGEIQHQKTVPLLDRGGEAALALVYELVDELAAEATRPLLGIGIGAPGLVDADTGVICRAVNLAWQDVPLGRLLEQRCGLPVYMTNDCQVAALAEYTFGVKDPSLPLVVIKIGFGIGAGIVIDGQLLHGQPFGAGEVGHVVAVRDGELCRCGNRGCLETIASRPAILRRVRALARNGATPQLVPLAATPEAITLDVVRELYAAGDEAVGRVVEDVGRHLGLATANLIGALGCCRVHFAGSVMQLGPGLLDIIREELDRSVVSSLVQCSEIDLASESEDIVLRGAAALVLAQEFKLL